MCYADCLEDITYAQAAIRKSKLLTAVNTQPICDVYCAPSHNHQTFYTQIYEQEQAYLLVYAKTYFASPLGLETVMNSFRSVIQAEKHAASRADVCCGMVRVPKDHAAVRRLLTCLPQKDEFADRDQVCLDGTATVIRNLRGPKPVVLGFEETGGVIKNHINEEQKEFLNELYLHMERIIGNLLVSSGKYASSFLDGIK